MLKADHILIERIHVVLEDVIGQGHFGSVYKAILHTLESDYKTPQEVAVKTLHSCELV